MSAALKSSQSDISIMTTLMHGTSTMADTIELGAVESLAMNYANRISMSSTKSSIGHLLGGGSVEAIFPILSIRDQIVPPTISLEKPFC